MIVAPINRKTTPPPSLPTHVLTVQGLQGTWEVVSCRTRDEKALAWQMLDAGIGYFLPMLKLRDSYRRTIHRPLFDGYLFACSADVVDTRERVRQMPGVHVLGFVPVPNQAQLVRELASYQHAILEDPGFGQRKAVRGEACEILDGPFRGFPGVYDREGRQGYAVLTITVLGDQRPVEVPIQHVGVIGAVA